jgi:hypothetical protein
VAPAGSNSSAFFNVRRAFLGNALIKLCRWLGVHFSFGKTKGAAAEMGFLPAANTLLTSPMLNMEKITSDRRLMPGG